MVPVHLLLEVPAYSVGYGFYQHLRPRFPDSISDENRLWIFIGCAIGALLGCWVLGLLEHPELLHPPGGWLY